MYQRVFATTLFERFAHTFHVRPCTPGAAVIPIVFAAARSYNHVDFNLVSASGRVYPIQVRQLGTDDTDDDADANIVGVINVDKKSLLAAPWLRAIQRGWLESGELHATFVATRRGNTARRRILTALFDNLALFFTELVATREPADAARPHVLLLQCKRGLERSLLMFNSLVYGLNILARGAAQLTVANDDGGASDTQALLRELGADATFRVRKRKFDAHATEMQIHNVLVQHALDSVPNFMAQELLPLPSAKRQRTLENKVSC